MNTICFQSVVPHVFTDADSLRSEVWGRNVNFERGNTYLVEAGSGRGKSTMCSYIVGYRHDYDGRVYFDAVDARSYSVSDWVNLRGHHVSCLFQELRLFPELTAWENVAIKNNITRHATDGQVRTWFEQLGIADKMQARVGRMSFGQQQRVALIRCLVQPFDFLLADEPISHLDDDNSQVVTHVLMDEVRRQGAALIVTSIGKHPELPYDKTLRL